MGCGTAEDWACVNTAQGRQKFSPLQSSSLEAARLRITPAVTEANKRLGEREGEREQQRGGERNGTKKMGTFNNLRASHKYFKRSVAIMRVGHTGF